MHNILDHSRSQNLLYGITGALLTDGSLFAQIIEGPPIAVNRLYCRIIDDPRHHCVMMLQYLTIHVRLFGSYPIEALRVKNILHAASLTAQSTPNELRMASIFILKAFRPVLLKQPNAPAALWQR